MANMSYCRFQNTYRDMTDVVNVMGDALDNGQKMAEFIAELSEDELFYFKKLMTRASDFVQYYEELIDNDRQEEIY